MILLLLAILNIQCDRDVLTYREQIIKVSRIFGFSPRILASIICAERIMNVKPGEDILDLIFAMGGYNSSIGLCQVKLETARWIEIQVNDPGSDFYPGGEIRVLFKPSRDRDELIEKLSKPEINILYAGCYIWMIMRKWMDVINYPGNADKKVGIIATIYSLGLTKRDGNVREPDLKIKINKLGEKAIEIYNSNEIISNFPEY